MLIRFSSKKRLPLRRLALLAPSFPTTFSTRHFSRCTLLYATAARKPSLVVINVSAVTGNSISGVVDPFQFFARFQSFRRSIGRGKRCTYCACDFLQPTNLFPRLLSRIPANSQYLPLNLAEPVAKEESDSLDHRKRSSSAPNVNSIVNVRDGSPSAPVTKKRKPPISPGRQTYATPTVMEWLGFAQ